MAVDIRQAIVGDFESIQRFMEVAYGPLSLYKGMDRLHWQFVSNPSQTKGDHSLSTWLAWSQEEIVGQVAVQLGSCWFGREMHEIGWIVDVMILEQYRGQGLGHRLYAAISRDVPTTLTLTMAPATRRIAEKQGALTLPPVRSMFKPSGCSADFIERFMAAKGSNSPRWRKPDQMLRNHKWANAGVASAINACSGLTARRRGGKMSVQAYRFEEIAIFDAEVDELDVALAGVHDVVCVRNCAYLNWRFVDVPHLQYRRILMRKQGQLVGVLVTRDSEAVELPIGIVCEVLIRPGCESEAEVLLDYALDRFDKRMQGFVAGASASWLVRVLRRRGFFTVKKHYPTVVTRDDRVRALCERKSLRCFFSKSDHDWDQIHLA